MADTPTPSRWTWRLLALAWPLTAAAAAAFAWQTTGAYIRQNLQPLPGDADLTIRECQAQPDCASNALDTVTEQLALLRHTRTLVNASAWIIVVIAAIVLTTATVLLLRRRHTTAARTLSLAWKLQAAIAALLLAAHLATLTIGANRLTTIPEPAQLTTSTTAFDQPYTDIGHLYYLAWLITTAAATVLFTWALHRSLRTMRQAPTW